MLKSSSNKSLKISNVSLSQSHYYHYFPTTTSSLLTMIYRKIFLFLCMITGAGTFWLWPLYTKKKTQHYLNACMVWLSCGFKVVIYICDLTPNEKYSILTCIYRNKCSKSGSMTQFWKLFLCSHLSCYDLNICLNLSVQMHFNLFKN